MYYVTHNLQSGRMPLHWACSGGRTEVVEFLVQSGVPVDARDDVSRVELFLWNCQIHYENCIFNI